MKIYILTSYSNYDGTKIEKLFISGKNARLNCALKNAKAKSKTYEVKVMSLNMDIL